MRHLTKKKPSDITAARIPCWQRRGGGVFPSDLGLVAGCGLGGIGRKKGGAFPGEGACGITRCCCINYRYSGYEGINDSVYRVSYSLYRVSHSLYTVSIHSPPPPPPPESPTASPVGSHTSDNRHIHDPTIRHPPPSPLTTTGRHSFWNTSSSGLLKLKLAGVTLSPDM